MAFHRLVQQHELYDGFRQVIRVDRLELLVLQHAGVVHVLDNRCPHQGFPLDRGTVRGERILCSRHGFAFRLTDGDCIQSRSCRLPVYMPTYEGMWLGIEV